MGRFEADMGHSAVSISNAPPPLIHMLYGSVCAPTSVSSLGSICELPMSCPPCPMKSTTAERLWSTFFEGGPCKMLRDRIELLFSCVYYKLRIREVDQATANKRSPIALSLKLDRDGRGNVHNAWLTFHAIGGPARRR